VTTANAMESLSFNISGLIGAGVAGLLIAIVGGLLQRGRNQAGLCAI